MSRTLSEMIDRLPEERRARIEARRAELVDEVESLRALRRQTGLTQADLAQALGKSQAAVSKLEAGSDMLLSTLKAYLQAMDCDLELVARRPDGSTVKLEAVSDLLQRESAADRSI